VSSAGSISSSACFRPSQVDPLTLLASLRSASHLGLLPMKASLASLGTFLAAFLAFLAASLASLAASLASGPC